MFRRVADFQKCWDEERKGTLKLLAALDDRSLTQAAAGDHRTLGRVAWHLTTTLAEMLERLGLRLAGPASDAPVPHGAAEIVRAYDAASRSVAEQVASWSDATLEIEDEMYGESWPRGFTLFVLVTHQAHHRGQLTVLMRLAGREVAGVYGPARQEWGALGMEPPAV